MNSQTRRNFLSHAAVATPAAILGATAVASADEQKHDRRVVGGSPYATFSRAVAYGPIIFVAGVVGQKPGSRDLVPGGFEAECRQALQNLKDSVQASGSSMSNVLKCTCFLTDAKDFATFNKVYVGFFPSEPPARSTVIVKELVVPGAKLEIDCVTSLG